MKTWAEMKVSDYVARFLEKQGVTHVFTLTGGMITHLLDSIQQRGHIQIVAMHHEQVAGFAAEAMGRLTNIPGVALATSGPGATNLLTAIGSCYFDSVPTVFITGQVSRGDLTGSKPVRQTGFQETDIVTMAEPVTKAAWQAKSAVDVPALLIAAFRLAMSGRPGPVLVDIPMDIQMMEHRQPEPAFWRVSAVPSYVDAKDVRDAIAAMNKAHRPVVLVGGGTRNCRGVLREFLARSGAWAVNSLMAVGTPGSFGMIGTYGNRRANLLLDRADFILVLGSRLDTRQTATPDTFKRDREIWHVDIDAGEINSRVEGCHAVVGDVGDFMMHALNGDNLFRDRPEWRNEANYLLQMYPDTWELRDAPGINPNLFMHQLSAAMKDAAGYCVDVGQHQMWAAQSLDLQPDQFFMTSGGMGAMGFALPAAIGACYANPGKSVVCIVGDGGMQVNIQELETIARLNLPVKIVVMNNASLGMVRQFQDSYFEGRHTATVDGYGVPDFEKIAEAYGIRFRNSRDASGLHTNLFYMGAQEGPQLLNVFIDPSVNVCPKVMYGKSLSEMEPAVEQEVTA